MAVTGAADRRAAEAVVLAHLDGEAHDRAAHQLRALAEGCGLPLPLPFRGAPAPPTLRTAGPADALAIAAVGHVAALLAYRHIFPPAAAKPTVRSLWHRWQGLLGELRAPGAGLVLDGAVAGSVVASLDPDDDRVGHVAGLYVHPDCWGQGFGVRLLEAALGRLRDAALPEVTLWVLRENIRARAMYERRGWVPDGGVRTVSTAADVDEVRYRLSVEVDVGDA